MDVQGTIMLSLFLTEAVYKKNKKGKVYMALQQMKDISLKTESGICRGVYALF